MDRASDFGTDDRYQDLTVRMSKKRRDTINIQRSNNRQNYRKAACLI